jgi:uncharacterized membrane protein
MVSSFPKDRVINFSDAIYAIAITLLVLEIKIPSFEEVQLVGIAGVLQARIPNFIGFVVSFLVTALFWRAHLNMFGYVKQVANRLLWLNLWQLLFVVMMPFSTALYSYYAGSNNAFMFYCLNVAGMGIMNYSMLVHIVKQENLSEALGPTQAQWLTRSALLVPLIFLLCIPLAWLNPWLGRSGFVLIFVLQSIGNARLKRRLAQNETVL